jgi:hypothetical protein
LGSIRIYPLRQLRQTIYVPQWISPGVRVADAAKKFTSKTIGVRKIEHGVLVREKIIAYADVAQVLPVLMRNRWIDIADVLEDRQIAFYVGDLSLDIEGPVVLKPGMEPLMAPNTSSRW